MLSLSHETSPPKSIIRDLYIISPVQVKWTPNNLISSAGPSPFLEELPPQPVPSTQEPTCPSPSPSSQTQENPFTIKPRYTITVLRLTFLLLLRRTSSNLPPTSFSLLGIHLPKKKSIKARVQTSRKVA